MDTHARKPYDDSAEIPVFSLTPAHSPKMILLKSLSLLFPLLIIVFGGYAMDDKVIKKVLQNFEENLFQELNQFSSFPDKDSKAISLQHNLESEPYSRIRRSFPDNTEQQAEEFSDKTHLDEISRDVLPNLASGREAAKPPEMNAFVSDQMINKSSHPDKMNISQSIPLQKSLQSQNSIVGQRLEVNLPVQTHDNVNVQRQLNQPLVKAEGNVNVPRPSQYANNANVLQQPMLAQSNVNGLQQPVVAQSNVNGLQQPVQSQSNVNGLQQPVQAQSNINGLQQPVQAKNSIAEQQMHAKSNLVQQPLQSKFYNSLASGSEHNSLNKLVSNPNGQFANNIDKVKNNLPINRNAQSGSDPNALPLNQQYYPVVKPDPNRQMIDNGGLTADQSKSSSINGNDEFVDKSMADNQHLPTKNPDYHSEFGMDNKLHAPHVSDNEVNFLPSEGNQQTGHVISQPEMPSKVSSSKLPFFMISTIKNVQKETEHSQEFGKQDDGWYYNQEVDDSLHQGVTESEKHAGKQMLMSAHHFDIPLGALAGAKMLSNDVWQKDQKQYLMNKKSETFEPMSMALFYSWIALAALTVLGILTIFRHRHKVTGYVYDLRYWHNGGYVEEGRRLLHNAYA